MPYFYSHAIIHAFQKSLDEVCVGRTAIIIAHRLSTITKADEIIVLKVSLRSRFINVTERGGLLSSFSCVIAEASSILHSF